MFLNGTELIECLEQHPKAVKALGMLIERAGQRATVRHDNITFDNYPDKTRRRLDCFERWLGGRVAEECDRLDIEIVMERLNGVKTYAAIRSNGTTNDVETTRLASRILAGLAGIEEACS